MRTKDHVSQVLPDYGKLDPAYIFILDIGHQLFQWNGSLVKNDDIMQVIVIIIFVLLSSPLFGDKVHIDEIKKTQRVK